MDEQALPSDNQLLAEAVRAACRRAAMEAYEDASMRGLCAEGAWECALGAIETIDLEAVVQERTEE